MAKTTQKWWQSRTIQFAAIQFIVGLIAAIIAEYPQIATIGWVAIVKSVFDILLRLDTFKKID